MGRLLGHRRRATTAIYAHLDDNALRDAAAQAAAAQAAAVIARAMGYRAGPPPLPDEADENARESNWSHGETTRASPTGPRKPVRPTGRRKRLDWPDPEGGPGEPARRLGLDWLGDDPAAPSPGTTAKDTAESACPTGWIRI